MNYDSIQEQMFEINFLKYFKKPESELFSNCEKIGLVQFNEIWTAGIFSKKDSKIPYFEIALQEKTIKRARNPKQMSEELEELKKCDAQFQRLEKLIEEKKQAPIIIIGKETRLLNGKITAIDYQIKDTNWLLKIPSQLNKFAKIKDIISELELSLRENENTSQNSRFEKMLELNKITGSIEIDEGIFQQITSRSLETALNNYLSITSGEAEKLLAGISFNMQELFDAVNR